MCNSMDSKIIKLIDSDYSGKNRERAVSEMSYITVKHVWLSQRKI